eukprot:262267-Pelagomonas_calceolata.AAC.4
MHNICTTYASKGKAAHPGCWHALVTDGQAASSALRGMRLEGAAPSKLRSVPSSSSAPFSLSSPDALSWQTPPDVRPQPALTTFQLAQLSSRQMSGATAALSGVAGHRAGSRVPP